jgi:hypothetical protein
MRTAGLAGRCPKRFRRTTIRAIAPPAEPPDLVHRDFNPTAPDELWVPDITYVRTWKAGCIWRSSWIPLADASWTGRSPIICAPSWRLTHCRWLSMAVEKWLWPPFRADES